MKKLYFSTILCLVAFLAISQTYNTGTYVAGSMAQDPTYANVVDVYGKTTSDAGFNYSIIKFNFTISIPTTYNTNVTATIKSSLLFTSGVTATRYIGNDARTYYTFTYNNGTGPVVNFTKNTAVLLATVTFTGGTGSTTVRLTDEYSPQNPYTYWYIDANTAGHSSYDGSGSISPDPTPPNYDKVYYITSGSSTNGTTSGSSQYIVTTTATALSASPALPVTLASFTAAKAAGKVNLAWATATESNTASFLVQRSNNGIDYAPVVSTVAVGAGANEYAAVDASPLSGTSFYRLKNIDKDGSFTYSSIVSVNFDASNKVSVYPSPAQSNINVNVSDPSLYGTVCNLVDLGGRTIKSFTITGNAQQVNVSNLTTGMYFVQLADGSTVKFTKN